MQFYSAASDQEDSDSATQELIDALRGSMDGVDVAFVFFTPHHREAADRIVERLWLELDPQCAIGCSAEGVIGDEREIEREPGIALLAGTMPGVRIHPFHIAGRSAWHDVTEDPDALRERLGLGPQTRAVIGLGDPFTTPLGQFLGSLAAAAPAVPLLGGMSSGGRTSGSALLIRNDGIFNEGLVGVSLSGPLEVRTIVSQGCRPVGRPFVITKSHDNVIEQLGGKPAMSALRDVVGEMQEPDRRLLRDGLMIGRAIDAYREQFERGDFLVRNVIGVDETAGSVSMADYVRTGQTVQFHVRDAAGADEDLRLLLEAGDESGEPAGGLLFSCNGRGTRMFDRPDHDIAAARQAMPATPLAGFFAAGEFGPVGGKNFIHGHTASFALFKPA